LTTTSSHIIPLFSFYCHCPHLTLHSFPTRRSSDLDRLRRRTVLRISMPVRPRPRSSRSNVPCKPRCDRLCSDLFRKRSEQSRSQDRKSTRLNSSHDQISYAVFCLKKKKKKHNTYIL